MEKKIGIYKITSPSGKIYIGQSTDVHKRFIHYRRLDCKNQQKLYYSLKKYGWKNHTTEIICECTKDELNDLEIYYINLHKSFNSNFGLNLKSGGYNGGSFSAESRKKISLSNTGKKHSIETRKKISASNTGMIRGPHTNETKLKISIANKGKVHKTGWHRSEETKQKISRNHIGKIVSKETCNKISISNKGKPKPPFTDEHKKKISKTKKGIPWSKARIIAQADRLLSKSM